MIIIIIIIIIIIVVVVVINFIDIAYLSALTVLDALQYHERAKGPSRPEADQLAIYTEEEKKKKFGIVKRN